MAKRRTRLHLAQQQTTLLPTATPFNQRIGIGIRRTGQYQADQQSSYLREVLGEVLRLHLQCPRQIHQSQRHCQLIEVFFQYWLFKRDKGLNTGDTTTIA